MCYWSENIKSFEPEVGFTTQFNVHSKGRDFLHMWKVTEVIPQKKLVYHWKYQGYSGESYVSFELFEEANQTKLRLSHEGGECFPQDIPEFTRESCIGGWTYFIKGNLKDYLDKDQ